MADADAPTDTINERDFIQSIERGFAVLTAFDADAPRPTLADIAKRTGFSRPAVRRILLTLQQLGYVTGSNGRWTLTPRVLSIGQHYTASHALIEISQPHLVALAEHTSEPASLAALDGTEVVHIADVPVRRIMSVNVSVGMRAAAYPTSMGRILLAWRGSEFIESYLGQVSIEPFTAQTVKSPDELRRVLEQVRHDGYSIVDEELEQGLLSASAPVRNAEGEVVAALASWTSKGRSTAKQMRDRVVPKLVELAASISTDLGHKAGITKMRGSGRG
ncbi:IclR family transcriptional regulator C-terminal domain-containing protein [Sphingomonas naphthae]|uniref:IclR family transcriptional regulator C-terminal domain-containing protein n=1 Tax=Sphingomonas naphthae TaxID=1813468 RepID=A0ABY7TMS6_9SPHN|nr:IclR family transcriptional regulator C-terminal domain-containing protein [Sphingomonas naphthae]WCT74527.1 IclR family transcriptional regulator C-terminal domain-containing protein [Sphingomonas naphthae]